MWSPIFQYNFIYLIRHSFKSSSVGLIYHYAINSFINLGLIDFDISVIILDLKEWDEYLWPKTSCIKLFTSDI